MSTTRPILVYRDALLPRSEAGFMRRQYAGFSTLSPLWVGRRVLADLDHSSCRVAATFPGLSGLGFKLAGHVPGIAGLRALGAIAVHAQFGRGGALALPLARALGLPLVVTFHGGDVSKDAHFRRFPLPALFALRKRQLAHYASALVCVSEGVRDGLIARGLPAEKAVVLPIGTDTLTERPRTGKGDGLLFVGRFVEMKGIAILLAAIARLRAQGWQQRVVLIGDGPDRDAVAAAAASLRGVELRGWQPAEAVYAAMRDAGAVCIPSVRARSGEAEGLPSVATEAMGLGVPVIATTQAGVNGLITSGLNGLLCPAGDPDALANAIATLLDDPARSIAFGAAARRRVQQDFDAMTQSRRLERLLCGVAAHPPASTLDFARILG